VWDWDHILFYRTQREALILDKYIGGTYRILQCGVIFYILFISIWFQKNYLYCEVPTGSVHATAIWRHGLTDSQCLELNSPRQGNLGMPVSNQVNPSARLKYSDDFYPYCEDDQTSPVHCNTSAAGDGSYCVTSRECRDQVAAEVLHVNQENFFRLKHSVYVVDDNQRRVSNYFVRGVEEMYLKLDMTVFTSMFGGAGPDLAVTLAYDNGTVVERCGLADNVHGFGARRWDWRTTCHDSASRLARFDACRFPRGEDMTVSVGALLEAAGVDLDAPFVELDRRDARRGMVSHCVARVSELGPWASVTVDSLHDMQKVGFPSDLDLFYIQLSRSSYNAMHFGDLKHHISSMCQNATIRTFGANLAVSIFMDNMHGSINSFATQFTPLDVSVVVKVKASPSTTHVPELAFQDSTNADPEMFHSIGATFLHTGTICEPQFFRLLIVLTSGLALFGAISLLVDLMMVTVMPLSKMHFAEKFIVSKDKLAHVKTNQVTPIRSEKEHGDLKP